MRDIALEQEMQTKGYVKVPYFTEQEVDAINEFYNRQISDLGKGYQSTMFSRDPVYRRNVNLFLRKMITPGAQRYLKDYHDVICTFLVKETEGETMVNLHADWCLTDEYRFQSMIIWVSLMDIDETSGALHFLPGSHHYTNKHRGHGLPFEYEKFDRELLKEHEEVVCTKKGEALIFDLSCLHYSNPNKNPLKPRMAFNVGLIPDEAPSLHYCHYDTLTTGLMEVFEVGDDFYHNYQLDKKPPFAKSLRVEKYAPNGYTNAQLEDLYRENKWKVAG